MPIKTVQTLIVSKVELLSFEQKQLISLQNSNSNRDFLYDIELQYKHKKQSYNELLFDKLCSLTADHTLNFMESKSFMQILNTTTNMSIRSFSYDTGYSKTPTLNIAQSDITSISFLQSLKLLLKDLKSKLKY